MHAFVAAVLLWPTGLDELGENAESHPPGGQSREARQGIRGERHAVVAADVLRQPILLEQPREDGLGALDGGARQAVAAQEVAAEAVSHRERIAVAAVAHPKLSLEVRTPHLIGCHNQRGGFAGMSDHSPWCAASDEPTALEEGSGDRAAGQPPRGVAAAQIGQQLLRSPRRMPMAQSDQRVDDWRGRRGGCVPRAARPILETARTPPDVAIDPLVGCLPGDTVLSAELRHRAGTAQMIRDEQRPLMHGCRLPPGHQAPPPVPSLPSKCHPCLRTEVSPMYPVCTERRANKRLQRPAAAFAVDRSRSVHASVQRGGLLSRRVVWASPKKVDTGLSDSSDHLTFI